MPRLRDVGLGHGHEPVRRRDEVAVAEIDRAAQDLDGLGGARSLVGIDRRRLEFDGLAVDYLDPVEEGGVVVAPGECFPSWSFRRSS